MLEANRKQGEELEVEDRELIMKLSPAYLEKLAEIEQQGLERGLQQGLERGLERGLQQGLERGLEQGLEQGLQQEANLIIRLLKRKLGNLPLELENKISSLPRNTLEDLGEALLDFNSVDDAIAWLGNN